MDYALKQVPEDFLVEEIPSARDEGEGNYSYFALEKKNLNTLRALRLVARALGIGMERIGWAGNKDKNALTKQLISIYDISRERAEKASIEGVKLSYSGRGSERIFIGNLIGNKFTIVMRSISEADCATIAENSRQLEKNGFLIPNYFDEQRFGGNNPEIGEALLKRNFSLAAREIYRNETENPLEALRRVHKSTLSLYVHAYQSLLFNETLSEYVRSSGASFRVVRYSRGEFLFPSAMIDNIALPVVGFGTELADEKAGRIAARVIERHGITQRDFVIRQLPELSIEGTLRDAFVTAADFKLGKSEGDELNPGMKKTTMRFSLPKGSYATIAVKALT